MSFMHVAAVVQHAAAVVHPPSFLFSMILAEIMKKQRKKKKIENRGSLSQVTKSPSSSKATS
ncbi:hypothetical protein PIB30_087245, partial [Stylosanthes scabra]|nr:hypothetical protein [Stylosanthes scabra]